MWRRFIPKRKDKAVEYEFSIKVFSEKKADEVRGAINSICGIFRVGRGDFVDTIYEGYEEVEADGEDEAAKIKDGNVVQLKSGGPAMTVANVEGDLATAVWYCDHARKYLIDDFAVSSIKKHEA